MDKSTEIKVINRSTSKVGYRIEELGVRRQFTPKESKDITFGELEALSFEPGGDVILKHFLVIKNEEAVKLLLKDVEPEYYYNEEDVKRLLLYGTLDEFLDCLDYAPKGTLEIVKDMAVSLSINDIAKRNAILDKLGFNVTKAIEIRDTKYDGESEEKAEGAEKSASKRRAAVQKTSESGTKTGRRTETPEYKIISIQE